MKGEVTILEEISSAELSLIKYPFRREHMTYRSINQWGSGSKVSGSLQFTNGATSGQQNFEGSSIMEVIMKQDTFLANIH